jgi:glutaredoxin
VLSDTELAQVQDASEDLTEPITLLLSPGNSDHPFEADLFNTARQISGVSMNRIMLQEGGYSAFSGKPTITIVSKNSSNIHYVAAPSGSGLTLFLEAIRWLGSVDVPPATEFMSILNNLQSPANITVLVAAACPHCPTVVRMVLAFAAHQPLLNVNIVDVTQFVDLIDRYKVRSTPTVIINDAATYVGQVSEEQIVNHLVSEGKEGSLTEVFKSMIDAGRADDAAELLCRENRPQDILPIYNSEEFSTRMGALVVMEEALEINPKSLHPILHDLIALLSGEDIALRGDTADLLGSIGDPKAIPALQTLLEDENPDVREAAQDALDSIQK